MPVKWGCPGHPDCQKIFLYVQALKGHVGACKHAQKRQMPAGKSDVVTMVDILQFAEDQKKGNITIAREDMKQYRRTAHDQQVSGHKVVPFRADCGYQLM